MVNYSRSAKLRRNCSSKRFQIDGIVLAAPGLRGKRAIAGGRRALRYVMFQAALVASHHNPHLRSFADRLRKAGKPHEVIITAVARKLVTIANAVCKSRQKWADHPT
ncbi:IS110 family transposase [Paracoccus laeviglucosivorans]|uniref:Transposase IS116/IS110/IS902 family protein n=1 Tax=Paracoccus laeviglucosivorans TaxID=1197861 RepID=A0A521FTA4_9RHOB|nr:IS110 family transposase [Paracoccus laeviglucosivorans]SMO99443.1 hypothetical protein SAMN06265221_14311 [Paracoccus laeviglucosivorans]